MVDALFEQIESPRLAAQVNVASGYNQFLAAINSLEPVQKLLEELREPEGALPVILRMWWLSHAPFDPQYENPNDVALAVYYWVLSVRVPWAARVAAELVAECPGCWWAWKVAGKATASGGAKTTTSSVTQVASGEPVMTVRALHSADCDVRYLVTGPRFAGGGLASPIGGGRITSHKRAPVRGRNSLLETAIREARVAPRNKGSRSRVTVQTVEAAP